jgi:hypothetical protein
LNSILPGSLSLIQIFNSSSVFIQPFDCDNLVNIGSRWTQWLERLQYFLTVNKTIEDDERVATLFLAGGSRLTEIHATLPIAVADSRCDTNFKKAIYRLNNYFKPKRNKAMEQFMFTQLKQEVDETIEQYVTRLRIQSAYCEFHDVDLEIVKQVLQSCNSNDFRRQLLKTENLDLTKLLTQGRIYDTVESQARIVESKLNNDNIETIDFIKKKKPFTKNKDNK